MIANYNKIEEILVQLELESNLRSSALVNEDGFIIESNIKETNLNEDEIGVHCKDSISEVIKMAKILKGGKLKHLIITFEYGYSILSHCKNGLLLIGFGRNGSKSIWWSIKKFKDATEKINNLLN